MVGGRDYGFELGSPACPDRRSSSGARGSGSRRSGAARCGQKTSPNSGTLRARPRPSIGRIGVQAERTRAAGADTGTVLSDDGTGAPRARAGVVPDENDPRSRVTT